MQIKKVLKRILAAVLALLILIGLCAGGFFMLYKPTLIFSAEQTRGPVSTRATGFLYGIAEEGVPSYNMVQSLDISSLATKTTLGMQHPIGEMGDVAGEALSGGTCDYLVVYLQDMYDTWYYDNQAIDEMKKSGTYDWKEYIQNVYFPKIKETVSEIKGSDYHDKIVYCIFNECDNGVWFGDWVTDPNDSNNGWHDFNDAAKNRFNEAWKLTYDYVKSLDGEALIAGPNNCDYDHNEMEAFLSFTSHNNCNPDVIAYHELGGERIFYDWQIRVKDLKELEAAYGISTDTPIIVTEYGSMQDNGNPNTMLKYITEIEKSGVYGDQAYWLLANNLCSTAADYNTPNSAWWVYRWYAGMSGELMSCKTQDMLHSDFGKAVKEKRELRFQRYMGLGAIDEENMVITALCSGDDYSGRVKIKDLKGTAFYGQELYIKISRITYQSIAGKVCAAEDIKGYTQKCSGTLTVDLPDMNSESSYYIEITPANESSISFENDNLYNRFEFEHGELLGNAYTYDSAYATTGDISGMVGGMENEGDGVKLEFNVPESGEYELKLIYGNSNAPYDESLGKQDSDGRTDSKVIFSVDGNQSELSFENTTRSELTSSREIVCSLEAGKHTMSIEHLSGTIVLDSLLVRRAEEQKDAYILNNADSEGVIAVAPADGYYEAEFSEPLAFSVNGSPVDASEKSTVYLRRGINMLDIQGSKASLAKITVSENEGSVIRLLPQDAELSGTAAVAHNELHGIDCITGITSDGGAALFRVNADAAGVYEINLLYANNEEKGVHSYNVDLVEEFVTISVNGRVQKELYCRNTMSWDSFTTVSAAIELEEGENIITLSNDGYNRFAGRETSAPHISQVTLYSVTG